MTSLAILSRDAKQYCDLLNKAALPDLEIIITNPSELTSSLAGQIQIVLGEPQLCAEHIDKFTHLKWMQSTWAGNRALLEARKKDYQLCGLKGIFGPSMCEFVFAYILHFSRNILGFHAAQQTACWSPPFFDSLAGKTLAIMGVGSIGQDVAKMAKAFDMRVLGFSQSSRDSSHVDKYFGANDIPAFAQQADYLVCLLPDTPHTKHIIDRRFMSNLPSHCVLINAGRGSTINEADLLWALHNKKLKAVVLDVFEQEPLRSDHPFWKIKNVHITQHTAAISQPTQVLESFIENYQRFHRGEQLQWVLSFEKGY